MPRPRIPTAKAKLTGTDKKHPERFKGRSEPSTKGKPVGDPPGYMNKEAATAWRELARTLGWLEIEDRGAVEVAALAIGQVRTMHKVGEPVRDCAAKRGRMERRFKIDADSLPDLAGMMLAVTDALRAIGSSASIEELDEKVIEQEGLTEEEQSFMMRNDENKPRVNYYLSWARTYLKRGGALENSKRGVWALTEKGQSLTTYKQAKGIYEQVQLEERERARQKRLEARKQAAKTADEKSLLDLEPEPEPDPEGDWRSDLLAALIAMSSDGFERLAQRLLRESGFTKVEVRGKTGDGGIDGVGVLRVNLVSFQVYFQCKKWQGSVGSKEIRDFRGAMQGRADKGLFITTGRFTAQASDEATRDGATAIDVIDGPRLCDLLKEQGLGVRTEMVEEVSIDSDWFKTV